MFARLTRLFFLWRSVFRDHRTPAQTKLLPWLSLVYILFPVDAVPDFLPILGQLDDVGVVIFFFWLAWKFIPPVLWREHVELSKRKNVIDV